MSPPRTPIEVKFWRRVSPCPNTGCWFWDGATTPQGYGVMAHGRGNVLFASRVSLDLHGKPRPDDTSIACHHCDVAACVNPDHLYWGSFSRNIQDAYDRKQRTPISWKGKKAPRTLLTREQVEEIRSSKETIDVLGARYGVNRSTIWLARVGRTYKESRIG